MSLAPDRARRAHMVCDGAAAPLIRPARAADLEAVLRLASAGGAGLTNLPADREALRRRIAAGEAAVADAGAREAGAAVLLVAELDDAVVATGMIWARVGAEWPFHSYRLTRQASRSVAVGRSKAQWTLNLANDFDGECEVGGLFVDPTRRGLRLGRLMARARYLFIAEHRAWFGRRVIAELRGWQDADGRSPMWEAIGRHFYDMDFHEADRMGAIHGNQFIADLGPRHPLYVSLLPASAQAALGRPHDDGVPARDMLLVEGFRDEGYVDIFDGGPTLVADIDGVATVRDAAATTVERVAPVPAPVLACAGHGPDFRGAAGRAEGATVDPALASALRVRPGDPIRHIAA